MPDGKSEPLGAGFELTADTVRPYLVGRGLLSDDVFAVVDELTGGVSATVLSVRAPGLSVVVKQALKQLKVNALWTASQDRTEIEAAAMSLCDRMTRGRVPRVLDSNPSAHVVVMELLPKAALNWQDQIDEGYPHVVVGAWAGDTLGRWHAQTAENPAVAEAFDNFDSFEELRLSPFYETVIERLPEASEGVAMRLEELRKRRCFVHGDFAMKNILVAPDRNWIVDFEVAHYGNPVFDVAFFLSFVVLSAIRWEPLIPELRSLSTSFLHGYNETAGIGFAGDMTAMTGHTAALILARTDGKSPAQFLDEPSRRRAREAGIALLQQPERGLWQWL